MLPYRLEPSTLAYLRQENETRAHDRLASRAVAQAFDLIEARRYRAALPWLDRAARHHEPRSLIAPRAEMFAILLRQCPAWLPPDADGTPPAAPGRDVIRLPSASPNLVLIGAP